MITSSLSEIELLINSLLLSNNLITNIFTLSLHDALPISFAQTLGARVEWQRGPESRVFEALERFELDVAIGGFTIEDRKSTRLNSSHLVISYAVFCLKKNREYINRQCFVTLLRLSHLCYR